MGYTAHELAEVSGVSVRTLHWYEEQGLLSPARRSNGYRDYGPDDVRRLQQILLWRSAGMGLAQIRPLLDGGEKAVAAALREQLSKLRAQRGELDALIATVEDMAREAEELAGGALLDVANGGLRDAAGDESPGRGRTRRGAPERDEMSIASGCVDKRGDGMKEGFMSRHFDDAKRFEAFKREAVEENERAYGREVRERYGDDVVDATNAQFMGLTGAQLEEAEAQQARIGELLAEISGADVPEEEILGDAGRALCALHKAWLLHFWKPEMYSPAAHRGLAQMYVADERFAAYYEAMAPDGAAILRDAIETWVERL